MIYLENVVSGLEELADRKLQRELWLSSGPPEVSSLTEAVERLFDDSGLSIALEGAEPPPEVDARTFTLLKQLNEAVAQLDLHATPEEQLADPRMDYVSVLARQALGSLRQRR